MSALNDLLQELKTLKSEGSMTSSEVEEAIQAYQRFAEESEQSILERQEIERKQATSRRKCVKPQ
jgi:hypothetical protein